ncbi:MAG: hypothetical protein IPM21_12830 [Acidobacteria bacterium]|nr:hypothetical protein [Acidobacteriota bacterium]
MKLFLSLSFLIFAAATVAAQPTIGNSLGSAIAGSGLATASEPEVPAKTAIEIPAEIPVDREKTAMLPQTASGYTRPDAKKRFRRYLNLTIGPYALLGTGIGAGFATATNEPEEWGKSWEGYGRRFASNVGRNAIRTTIIYGLDEAFKVDSYFYRSEKRDVGSRISNSFISVVTARKPNGKRTIGAPRLIGVYTADVIASETWFPERYSWKDGMRNGTVALGFNVALNLFREFILK